MTTLSQLGDILEEATARELARGRRTTRRRRLVVGVVALAIAAPGIAYAASTLISADDVGASKPSARVYRHAAQVLGRPIDELRLISSNPFDVIGAKTAGMHTAWVNRSGTTFDSIGAPPDITVASLADLREPAP